MTHGLPAWALGRALGVPRSTVSAWLRRLGLNRPPSEPAAPVQRYEWPTAGDMIHVDIKPLGRFRQAGHRVHGDRQRCSPGAGWEYVHVAVDDHTRLAYVEVLPDQRGPACGAFLERAIAWYRARGITCSACPQRQRQRVSVTRFSRGLRGALALRHRRTRPYTPRTNGKAERFIQTLLREWAYVAPYATSQERRRALRPWVRDYNRERPHASLGYQPPLTRLQRAA